jgi:hypothetical protein
VVSHPSTFVTSTFGKKVKDESEVLFVVGAIP